MADPLSVAGSAVGIISLGIQVTQSLFDYYTALRSQHSDAAHTAKRLDSLAELLKRLHQHCENRKFRVDEAESVRRIESLIQECQEFIQELRGEADKFKKTPATNIQSAVKITARRVAYPFRKSTLQKLDEDIAEITDRLKLALQILQQEVIDRVQDDVQDTKALLELVRSSQISSELQSWLKAPDATINFNEACKKSIRVLGSGSSTANPSMLGFIAHGFAGCGKSVLCSTAIQHAFRHRRSHPRIAIAFFFFTFNDKNKQDASSLLRALILQLSAQLENHNNLSRLHGSYRYSSPPDEALLGCLHQLVGAFQHVYVLVDALDESPRSQHREAMLQVIRDIRAWKESGLHLLVTSRDEVDIQDEMEATPEETIEMKNAEVDRDIADFVAQHLRGNRRLRKWQRHYDRIEKALTDRANGVFRWVECQFTALSACAVNQHLLNQLLQSLPRSLDETYARMLKNIEPEMREYARRMLKILCCAIRPLTDLELIDALAVKLDKNPRFDVERRFQDLNDLQLICPGFIEIDLDLDKRGKTVRIAHFSVQEYLEGERILEREDVSIFHVRKQDAHINMAAVCLALLLKPQGKELQDTESIEKDYPLAKYAAHYWPQHIASRTLRRSTEKQILQLFQDPEGTFSAWVHIWNVDDWNGRLESRKVPSPIYYAALLGLTKILGELLNEECSTTHIPLSIATPRGHTNGQNGDLETVLQGASSGGHREVVNGLPKERGEVNAQGGVYGNALQAASSKGHEKIVQMLLDHGAEVNAQGGVNGNALQAASYEGREKIVQMLLDKGAEVNAQGGVNGNALQAASSKGHEKIVQMLLDHGAEVNAQGGVNGNALQAASYEGHEKIVQMLLDHGAEVNAQGGVNGNALQAASYEGREKIVQMLLDKGAEVNAQGGVNGNAFQAASSKGHEKIVQMLLDHGAEVNAQGGVNGNALQAASYEGREKIVQMLLDKGAEVNAQGGVNGNALQAASSKGHEKIVQMLLDHGAEVNAQGGEDDNALQAASSGGHEKIVQMLLDKGAEVNAQGGWYGNALYAALSKGRENIVDMLLKYGANLDFASKDGLSPLHLASRDGKLEIAKFLVQHFASVDTPTDNGETPMHLAATNGHAQIVELLLQTSTNHSAINSSGLTPLDQASFYDHPVIESLLLTAGAASSPDVLGLQALFGSSVHDDK
ncbi:hypothetical protein PG995_004493 [Apiospora arundinis]